MTVLPLAVPLTRPPAWLHLLRGGLAAAASAVLGTVGPLALGVLAFVLVPACSRMEPSPPALQVAALGALAAAAVVPVALAGVRLWWVGVPAAALAVHGLLPVAWPLLTETQTGFCF